VDRPGSYNSEAMTKSRITRFGKPNASERELERARRAVAALEVTLSNPFTGRFGSLGALACLL
jgi:hypothetical protein